MPGTRLASTRTPATTRPWKGSLEEGPAPPAPPPAQIQQVTSNRLRAPAPSDGPALVSSQPRVRDQRETSLDHCLSAPPVLLSAPLRTELSRGRGHRREALRRQHRPLPRDNRLRARDPRKQQIVRHQTAPRPPVPAREREKESACLAELLTGE